MPDSTNGQSKQTLLSVIILALILAVSIQGWYMYNMKKQLETVHKQNTNTQQVARQPATITITPQQKNQTQTSIVTTDRVLTKSAQKNAGTTKPDRIATQQFPVEQQLSVQATDKKPSVADNDTNTDIDNDVTADRHSPWTFDDNFYQTFDNPAWNPYKEMDRMRREMGRMQQQRMEAFNNDSNFHRQFSMSTSAPQIKVQQDDEKYTVSVELPGAKENDISVTLDGRRLSIKGKQDYKKQDKDASGNIIFNEHRSNRFQRSIILSDPVKQNEMKTHLDNGILTIIIPKSKDRQWRR